MCGRNRPGGRRVAEGNSLNLIFFSQGLAGIITVSKNVSIRTYNALSCMAEIEREEKV
jgi:hypothetical protein